MKIVYYRNTHDSNGNPKEFPDMFADIWSNTGVGEIGHMLDSNKGMTFEELIKKIKKYNKNCRSYYPKLSDDIDSIDYSLTLGIGLGFIRQEVLP